MPDTDDTLDYGSESLMTDDPAGSGGPGAGDDGAEQPYLKTPASVYKTREEAEKGIAELQRSLAEAQRERAELRRTLEQSAGLTKIAESIERSVQPKGKSAEDYEREIREKLREDPDTAFDLIRQTADEVQRRADERVAAAKEELDKKFDTFKAQFDDYRIDQNPAYRDNKAEVEAAMTEFGVDREKALRIVQRIHEQTDQAGPGLPGGMGGGHAGARNGRSVAYDDSGDRSLLVAQGVDPNSETGKRLLKDWRNKAVAR